jgi:hypothetical protein
MNWQTLFETKAPGWTVLIRVQVGLMVFSRRAFRSWSSLTF